MQGSGACMGKTGGSVLQASDDKTLEREIRGREGREAQRDEKKAKLNMKAK